LKKNGFSFIFNPRYQLKISHPSPLPSVERVEVRAKGRFVMKKDVAVIGVGQSSFVRGYEGSIRELAFEAFREAMKDAGITQKDVDASVFCSAPE
jgi:3-oxoacyl-[acyl-carrier-protein] synthase III